MTDRRSLLTLSAGLALAPAALRAQGPVQGGAPADPRMAERAVGNADAPATVIEFFSLTCTHCAAFHRGTWPKVKSDLVTPGRVRMVFRDFPLDQLALAAAAVARALPAERYEPFISTLFSSQDRWAFNRNADPKEELFKIAALAGMARPAYDAALADQALQRAILEQRVKAQTEFNVNSTPTFVFGGNRAVPGEMSFDRFVAQIG